MSKKDFLNIQISGALFVAALFIGAFLKHLLM